MVSPLSATFIYVLAEIRTAIQFLYVLKSSQSLYLTGQKNKLRITHQVYQRVLDFQSSTVFYCQVDIQCFRPI